MNYNTLKQKRFDNLQILRGVAAFTVLLGHMIHYLSIKSLLFLEGELTMGVNLFFVLSGFLMAYLLEIEQNFFLVRRLVRIYPTFFMAIFFYEFTYILLNIGGFNILDMWESLTLLPLSDAGRMIWYPLGIEWTLVYEIFFYFICFMFSFRFTKRYFLFFLLIWFFIIIYVNNYVPFISDNLRLDSQFSFLLTPNYKWIFFSPKNLIFIFGALTYYLYKSKFTMCTYCFFYYIFIIIVMFITSMKIGPHNLLGTVLQSLTFSLLILTFINLEYYSNNNFKSKTLEYLKKIFIVLGDYSYGIYLTHVFVIIISIKIYSLYISNIFCLSIITFFTTMFFGFLFGKLDVSLHNFSRKKIDKISLKRTN